MAPVPAVRLTLRCNNRCVMCAQAGLEEAGGTGAGAGAKAGTVCFTGGEPLLAPDLLEQVRTAKAAGTERICIQTNGRNFAERVDELELEGLTHAHLSIHGATAKVHDYHTGVPGSFTEVELSLAACSFSDVDAVVTTVLTRSNFRVLAPLVDYLDRHRAAVKAWMIVVPHVRGRAATDFDRVYPRLGLALPYALHAMRAAERLKLPVRIAGAPLCALGPFATRAHPSPERSYGRACESCAARPGCPGLDSFYMARFAADELRPRDAVSPPASDPIWDLFTGPGEMAPLPVVETHDAPATARKRLPVLGKSKPAVAEVRKAAKKSGEELGEIFPALFERVEE